MLFREHCTVHPTTGFMVKDLSRLGRRLENVIIIDNSPNSYFFQPENALPSLNWIKDKQDCELRDMMPFLIRLADNNIRDVRKFLPKVVDIFEGSKQPYFNRSKANHLLKIMNHPDFVKDNILADSKPKIDLREEIRKV